MSINAIKSDLIGIMIQATDTDVVVLGGVVTASVLQEVEICVLQGHMKVSYTCTCTSMKQTLFLGPSIFIYHIKLYHTQRIQVTFGLLIQNFRAVLTRYNSYLLTLATLHRE